MDCGEGDDHQQTMHWGYTASVRGTYKIYLPIKAVFLSNLQEMSGIFPDRLGCKPPSRIFLALDCSFLP